MDNRKETLLKEIVESYIKTVRPVGSKSLCNKLGFSSATIRNEMSVLESLGYIEKNHISSGRIPSEKGYKYYVDNIMEPEKLTGKDVLKLQKIFSNNTLVINDTITQCMEIISDLTNYASVVLGKSSSDNLLQKLDIISLNENSIVALVCTDKGIVENKKFILPEGTDIKEIVKISEIINKFLIGTPINMASERLEFEIKPIIVKEVMQYETIYNIFYSAFSDFAGNTSVHVAGKSNILSQPEYQNVEDLKKLAYKLDDVESLKKLDKDSAEDVKIFIGNDNDVDPDVTVIKKNFKHDGEEGTIAIIGPTRMDYKKIVSLLQYVDDKLERKDE
ncbi:MAG: heat-inducible transcriptional repressor HrcA [bacterium]